MRYYELSFTTHHKAVVSPAPDMVSAQESKVGVVASVMFRKVYGRAPDDLFWVAKGFMAGAADKRGNQLTVTQINDDMRPGFDPKTCTFPLRITS